jgi:hypothetical protein
VIGRVFRMVRTPITLLILLGVLCYGAWWGYTNLLKPVPAAPPTPCVPQRVNAGELRTTQVTVSVFNGGSKKGLAGDVGRSLRSRGFKVQKTTNTGEKIKQTIIVGAGAKNPEVLLVQRFFKKSKIKVDKRADHSVDVLVGDDYAGFDKKAKDTFAVKAKTVCLPAVAPSTAAPNS